MTRPPRSRRPLPRTHLPLVLLATWLAAPVGCKVDDDHFPNTLAPREGGASITEPDGGGDGPGPDSGQADSAGGDDDGPAGAASDGPVDEGVSETGGPAVSCQVSDWGHWMPCTASCGGGTQIRVRSVVTAPTGGGAACPTLVETQACNSQPCAVDCQLSAWSAWGPCSKPCGGGTQTRTRQVVAPPASGGAPCGELMQTQACNTGPPNACGGCATLDPAPQAACGACGKAVCAGAEQTMCNDPVRTCQQVGATCGGPPDGCGGQLSCGSCDDPLTSCSASFSCSCGKPTSLGSPAGGLETGKRAVSPSGRFYASSDGVYQTGGQLVLSLVSVKGFDWHPSRPDRFAIMRHFAPPRQLSLIEVYDIVAGGVAMLVAEAESDSQWHHHLAWQADDSIALGAENACRTVATVKPQSR